LDLEERGDMHRGKEESQGFSRDLLFKKGHNAKEAKKACTVKKEEKKEYCSDVTFLGRGVSNKEEGIRERSGKNHKGRLESGRYELQWFDDKRKICRLRDFEKGRHAEWSAAAVQNLGQGSRQKGKKRGGHSRGRPVQAGDSGQRGEKNKGILQRRKRQSIGQRRKDALGEGGKCVGAKKAEGKNEGLSGRKKRCHHGKKGNYLTRIFILRSLTPYEKESKPDELLLRTC